MSSHSAYIATVKDRIKTLTAELEHLKGILALSDEEELVTPKKKEVATNGKERKHDGAPGIPKGSMSWDDYIIAVLKEIGGKCKTTVVAEYVSNANPRLGATKALSQTRHHLSKLGRSERIGAIRNKSMREGYEYFVKSEAPLFEKEMDKK